MSDPYERLGVRRPFDRHYPAEVRRAAAAYLAARGGVVWSLAVLAVLVIAGTIVGLLESDPAPQVDPGWVILLLAAVATAVLAAFNGNRARSLDWMFSLRRLAGLPPVSPNVGTARYARAVLASHHPAGELETALSTLWQHSGPADEAARRMLADHLVPDVSTEDYQPHPGAPWPWWDRYGRAWQDAPLPDVDHDCQPWTIGVPDAGTDTAIVTLFCACCAVRYEGHRWTDRNQRRNTAPAG